MVKTKGREANKKISEPKFTYTISIPTQILDIPSGLDKHHQSINKKDKERKHFVFLTRLGDSTQQIQCKSISLLLIISPLLVAFILIDSPSPPPTALLVSL